MSETDQTEESIEDVAEAVEQSDKNVGSRLRAAAIAYWVALTAAAFSALAYAVYRDWITPGEVVSSRIGWYAAVAVAAMWVIFSFAMLLIALPGSVGGAIVRIAGGVYEAFGGE